MIGGTGIDIIEIYRIKSAMMKNNNFIYKIFTEREIDYFERRKFLPEVVAGNFAAKEAIAKALGTGFRKFSLRDIEILRDELGAPVALLHGSSKELVKEPYKLHVSISHSRENAIAYAVLEVY
ncbi:holo-ACP synthase [Clostridium peptidivorans]|uniref:holo-ACP synthase n=1 Tax=Clostridium peptidivorans TaxID=100174 RepID=UPI000BE3BDDE|nr:holo-ACP synthase [Clostridium peptidivorans]